MDDGILVFECEHRETTKCPLILSLISHQDNETKYIFAQTKHKPLICNKKN